MHLHLGMTIQMWVSIFDFDLDLYSHELMTFAPAGATPPTAEFLFLNAPINILITTCVIATWDPWGPGEGACPAPFLHKMLNISETVRIPTHKPYIFLFLMIRRIQ